MSESAILSPPKGMRGQLNEKDWRSPTDKYVVMKMSVGTLEQGFVVSTEDLNKQGSKPEDIARMLNIKALRFANEFEAEMEKVTLLEGDPSAARSLEELLAKSQQEVRGLQSDLAMARHEISVLRRSQASTAPMTEEAVAQFRTEIALKDKRIQDLEQQNANMNAKIAEQTAQRTKRA